ncbi:hypothetical protein C8R45DRAFT_810804 [Mycena sanguinolenta]|nr:hypothetical protein C8R45DRAFT_810804 [Mycena sanguinolenta]
MQQTPWTKKSSSVPSDRIRPSPPPASNPGKNSKGKGKTVVSEPPKSKAVRHLESLKNGLSASSGNPRKDPKGGCFCQAREHPLSTYSALCRNCGLVFCEINLPQYSCPHCSASLLTNTQRDALIARLEEQIEETLTKEALLRERAAEEARRAAGAFPTLGNATSRPPPPAAPQTRTVISLSSKTKKVTVSSFTTPSPSPSRPASRAESPEEEAVRVRAPPAEVPFAPAAKVDPLRPWKDLSGGGAIYIPPPNLDDAEDLRGPGQKRQGKGKAKENEAGQPGSSRVSTNT